MSTGCKLIGIKKTVEYFQILNFQITGFAAFFFIYIFFALWCNYVLWDSGHQVTLSLHNGNYCNVSANVKKKMS